MQDKTVGKNHMGVSRRSFIKTSSAVSTMGAGAMLSRGSTRAEEPDSTEKGVVKGRVNQSVCRWCYGGVSLEELAAFSAQVGIKSVELVGPGDWPTLKKHGLICAMSPSHGIVNGLNRTQNHAECLAKIRQSIEQTAEAGFPNVICLSGNRAGMDDEEGLKNCVVALKQVAALAEKKNVTLCMELLNSKRDHKDYMCDRTHWGAELVRQVGSPRVKLLYDIYHMQIQEGDVIATIRENHEYIAHYHTGGVPGRHEIDASQELNYPAIMQAIVDTGFEGYVGQEFIPARDPLKSLAEAVSLCDV